MTTIHGGPNLGDLARSGGDPSSASVPPLFSMADLPANVARPFLHALFGGKPEDARILIWQLRGKKSYWYTDLDRASEQVARLSAEDVYVGVALSPEDFGPSNRCKAADTRGIVALWGDIDVLSEAHKKRNLPPTISDALKLFPEGLEPTIVVNSGHGLQGWWLFKEPLIFEKDADREEAAALATQFNDYLRHRAAQFGWDVATNTKIENDHRPVVILSETDRRYDPTDIRQFLDEGAAFKAPRPGPRTPKTVIAAPSFKLDAAANPPFDKFKPTKRTSRGSCFPGSTAGRTFRIRVPRRMT